MISGGIWIFFFRGRRKEAILCLSYLTTAFYLVSVFYVFFPVKGTKYRSPELHRIGYPHFEGFLFPDLMELIFDNVTLSGAAMGTAHFLFLPRASRAIHRIVDRIDPAVRSDLRIGPRRRSPFG